MFRALLFIGWIIINSLHAKVNYVKKLNVQSVIFRPSQHTDRINTVYKPHCRLNGLIQPLKQISVAHFLIIIITMSSRKESGLIFFSIFYLFLNFANLSISTFRCKIYITRCPTITLCITSERGDCVKMAPRP